MHEIIESSPLNQTQSTPTHQLLLFFQCIVSKHSVAEPISASEQQVVTAVFPARCFSHLGEIPVISPSGGPWATHQTSPFAIAVD